MSATPPYVELHAHSAYSFLDGASLPQELIERAGELGYGAFGLTDHDSLAGAMELAITAPASVRAIFGTELTVQRPPDSPVHGSPETPLHHLTLLVRDVRGWRNLCRLLTLAHAHTRDCNDRRAGQPSVAMEQVLEHSEGLVCLTGCATSGVHDEPTARRLLDAFGPDRLRVELQRPYARGDRARNRALERLARRLGVATVATGDVHAHTPVRALLQDVFVAIRNGMTLDASEVVRRPNHTHVLARPEAMAARFDQHPDAVAETVRLADTLRFDLAGDLGYRYPGSESHDATRALAETCRVELHDRYPPGSVSHEQAQTRLERELSIIDSLGLAGFFMLHHEILDLARDVAVQVRGPDSARALLPPGRGRGSSVSSIVCYLTGLSHIDPVANDLEIGRFLHEDITGLPDIDIDFPRDIRERLIPAIHQRYGREHTALVAAFPTFRARGAIREIGKALGLAPGELDRVARGSEGRGAGDGVEQDIEIALGGRWSGQQRWTWLARLCAQAQGLPRHLSQHSGGMVISTRPLIDCCPVVPAAMEGRQIVQWDKDSCADAGFLKIDLLGLGMLSAVERCVEMISQRHHRQLDLSRIPFDDRQTFEAIQRAETTGVFQVESRAQMGSLRRTRPASLKDLAVQVAIVRPGPIVGGAVSPYIKRRQALLADPDYRVPYLHPSLEGPLAETLGTIIFQDQVMDVARVFAGFNPGEAESLRRAMSRKRSREAIDGHRRQFVEGAHRTHPDADEEVIERVWSMVAGFSGFGFPKGHAASFGLLAYQSTWLRVHHPAEFLCALLNEQPMGFYAPDSLIHEAQHRQITILAPDVNDSDSECTLTPAGAIRIGLGYVKGIHTRDAERLVDIRTRSGTFQTLSDLAARCGLTRPALELLAWSGACDQLAGGGPHARRMALWQLAIAQPPRTTEAGQQLTLPLPLPQAPRLRRLDDREWMIADYATTGISIDRHPLGLLRTKLADQGALSTAQLTATTHASRIAIAGLVIARQRPPTANGITFLLLEDEHGTLNVIVPPKLYAQHRATVRTEPLVLVHGRLERHADGGGAINLLASGITRLAMTDEQTGAAVSNLREPVDQTEDTDFTAVAPPVTSFAQGRRR